MVEQHSVSGHDAGASPRAPGPSDRGASARTVSPRRAFWLSFALFFALFTVWALSNPLTAAPDEPSHATKAAAVVRGELTGRPVAGMTPGFGGVDVPNIVWHMQVMPFCYYFQPDEPASCLPEDPPDPGKIVYAETTASNYNPLYYFPTGLPTLLPMGAEMLYLMRLIGALMCAFAMAWAMRSLAELRGMSWPVLGLLAGTTPMVVYLASSLSPAALEICTAIGLWTALLALVRDPDPTRLRVRMAGIAVLASVLVNMRAMSPLFLAIIVGSVVLASPWSATWTVLRDRRSWPWLGMVAVASAAALAWMRYADLVPAKIQFPELGIRVAAKRSIGDTWVYLSNMVGQFGWVDTNLPNWLIIAVLAAIAAVFIAGMVLGTVRERVVLLLLGAACFALPVAIHAWQAKYVGIVWQGRYFLPAAVGFPLLAGFAARGRRERPRPAGRILPLLGGALVLAQLIAFAVNLHRYAVGADGPWWGSPPDLWQPPGTILGLTVAAVALWAGMLWLLMRIANAPARLESPEPETPEPETPEPEPAPPVEAAQS